MTCPCAIDLVWHRDGAPVLAPVGTVLACGDCGQPWESVPPSVAGVACTWTRAGLAEVVDLASRRAMP